MSQPQSLLNASFNRPKPEQFWHFMMKTRKIEGVYRSEQIEARIQEIIAKKGSNSFTIQSENGWTPAHVAVLSDNEAGLHFLKSRGALALDVKGNDGATPLDYARMYQPNLVKFFEETLSCLKCILPKWKVSLPKTPFTYCAHSNDFGVEIKSLLFSRQTNNSKEQIIHMVENLKLLSEKFGFDLAISDYPYCLRDSLVRLPNGKVVLAGHSENLQQAVDRNTSRALIFRDHTMFLTDHLIFKGSLGASDRHWEKGINDIFTHFNTNEKGASGFQFCMEGGNHYSLTNRLGQRILIFGEDTRYIALNQMRLDGIFNEPQFSKSNEGIEIKKGILSLDPSLLKRTLEEMYAQGLLKPGNGREKGLLSEKEVGFVVIECDSMRNGPYQAEGNPYLDIAIKKKMFSPLDIPSSELQNYIEVAAKYLAQIEVVSIIMAASFKVRFDNIVFVPQLDYHLDVFLRPGPNCLFMQDYVFTDELLGEIEKNSNALELSGKDKEIIKRYRKTAQKFAREFGPISLKTKEILTAAGFNLVPVPALFYDVSPNLLEHISDIAPSTLHLNFLNAITGWSSKANSYFYIASGARVGDKLGEVLMNSFEEVIKYYEPNTQVCFVGYDPNNPTDFSESMRLMNDPSSHLGPHCLSFEKETADHIS
jgi:hypothetical protein